MSNRWHKTSSSFESLDSSPKDINLRLKHKKDDSVGGFNLIEELKSNSWPQIL
jgi:hypothetical protein